MPTPLPHSTGLDLRTENLRYIETFDGNRKYFSIADANRYLTTLSTLARGGDLEVKIHALYAISSSSLLCYATLSVVEDALSAAREGITGGEVKVAGAAVQAAKEILAQKCDNSTTNSSSSETKLAHETVPKTLEELSALAFRCPELSQPIRDIVTRTLYGDDRIAHSAAAAAYRGYAAAKAAIFLVPPSAWAWTTRLGAQGDASCTITTAAAKHGERTITITSSRFKADHSLNQTTVLVEGPEKQNSFAWGNPASALFGRVKLEVGQMLTAKCCASLVCINAISNASEAGQWQTANVSPFAKPCHENRAAAAYTLKTGEFDVTVYRVNDSTFTAVVATSSNGLKWEERDYCSDRCRTLFEKVAALLA